MDIRFQAAILYLLIGLVGFGFPYYVAYGMLNQHEMLYLTLLWPIELYHLAIEPLVMFLKEGHHTLKVHRHFG